MGDQLDLPGFRGLTPAPPPTQNCVLTGDTPKPPPQPPFLVDERTEKMPCAPGAWGSPDRCVHHEGQPLDENGKCFWGRPPSRLERAEAGEGTGT